MAFLCRFVYRFYQFRRRDADTTYDITSSILSLDEQLLSEKTLENTYGTIVIQTHSPYFQNETIEKLIPFIYCFGKYSIILKNMGDITTNTPNVIISIKSLSGSD